MIELVNKIASITGVSPHWLREGRPHDAPEWARDYGDPDVEALEQLRAHLTMKIPRDEQEALMPRHPSAADLRRWIEAGRRTGWAGDSQACWRGWLRHTSQLEEAEIQAAVHADADDRADRLAAELAEAKAALATLALRLARSVDMPRGNQGESYDERHDANTGRRAAEPSRRYDAGCAGDRQDGPPRGTGPA